MERSGQRGSLHASDGSDVSAESGIDVVVRNRQRRWSIDRVRLGALTRRLLREVSGVATAEFGVQLVGARTMARLNWRWLRHTGSTDVVTFDHGTTVGTGGRACLHGECFVSVDDAVAQAAVFGTTPDAELARYVVHAVLHLLGHDDLEASARRAMKREENRIMRHLARWPEARGLIRRRG